MAFTLRKFVKALLATAIIGMVAVMILRHMGVIGPPSDPGSPSALIRAATEGLDAIPGRKAGDRRPAGFDAVLAPLDKLLAHCKQLLESETYDPVNNYEDLRTIAMPVIDIATRADAAARNETGMLTKDYRFNEQKAEACQYLANAMWERIIRRLPQQTGLFGDGVSYPPEDMKELRRILEMGVQADPESADLWYEFGVLNRAEGLFAPAAYDLRRAVSFRNDFPAAWNTLGLVLINLKEFDKAEEALEHAKAFAQREAERASQEPGEEYAAIVYNLAMFHDNLAAYYTRENRITPTVENQRLLAKHSNDARKYLEEFLSREPADSADAKTAKAKLQELRSF